MVPQRDQQDASTHSSRTVSVLVLEETENWGHIDEGGQATRVVCSYKCGIGGRTRAVSSFIHFLDSKP